MNQIYCKECSRSSKPLGETILMSSIKTPCNQRQAVTAVILVPSLTYHCVSTACVDGSQICKTQSSH